MGIISTIALKKLHRSANHDFVPLHVTAFLVCPCSFTVNQGRLLVRDDHGFIASQPPLEGTPLQKKAVLGGLIHHWFPLRTYYINPYF